jgi:hypothetical protein
LRHAALAKRRLKVRWLDHEDAIARSYRKPPAAIRLRECNVASVRNHHTRDAAIGWTTTETTVGRLKNKAASLNILRSGCGESGLDGHRSRAQSG